MICKLCGLENAEGSVKCSRCGTPLEDDSLINEEQENKESDTEFQMIGSPAVGKDGGWIHDCGYPLLPNTKVCPNCHKPVILPDVNQLEEEEVIDDKKTKFIDDAPVNDPKKTVVSGIGQAVDPKKTMFIGNVQAIDPKKTVVSNNGPAVDPKKTMFIGNAQAIDPKKTVVSNNGPAVDPKKTMVIGNAQPTVQKADLIVGGGAVYNPKKTIIIAHSDETETKKTEEELTREAKKTVNPYAAAIHSEEKQEVYCSIQPVADEGENDRNMKKFEFGSCQIVLNRSNTEPSNYSITSKEQAELTFEDGQWFIEDKSTFQTTFVRAGRKLQLQDGDIILLGDRKFVFNSEPKDHETLSVD